MSENNFTLNSYDDSFTNYCNHDNYIGKYCLMEGRRKGGREEGRKRRMEGKDNSES